MSSYRGNSLEALAAAAATASGVAGVVGIQQRLDYTLANLETATVQTTTVDPNPSYGDRVVFEKPIKTTGSCNIKYGIG